MQDVAVRIAWPLYNTLSPAVLLGGSPPKTPLRLTSLVASIALREFYGKKIT